MVQLLTIATCRRALCALLSWLNLGLLTGRAEHTTPLSLSFFFSFSIFFHLVWLASPSPSRRAESVVDTVSCSSFDFRWEVIVET